MAEHAIINASPLIFFCRSAHEDLLGSFAGKLLVPQAVAAEILARGTQDPTARVLLSSPEWLSIIDAPPIPQEILDWGLGRGESEVLCVASARGGVEAIIDDLAARKCAASIGVPVRGTLGIVLLAKQRGLISQARPVLDDMLRAGLYLSRHVLDEALRRAGE